MSILRRSVTFCCGSNYVIIRLDREIALDDLAEDAIEIVLALVYKILIAKFLLSSLRFFFS